MCIQLHKYSVAEGQSLSYIRRMKSIGSLLGNLIETYGKCSHLHTINF